MIEIQLWIDDLRIMSSSFCFHNLEANLFKLLTLSFESVSREKTARLERFDSPAAPWPRHPSFREHNIRQ